MSGCSLLDVALRRKGPAPDLDSTEEWSCYHKQFGEQAQKAKEQETESQTPHL